jgi:hypothetical protein
LKKEDSLNANININCWGGKDCDVFGTSVNILGRWNLSCIIAIEGKNLIILLPIGPLLPLRILKGLRAMQKDILGAIIPKEAGKADGRTIRTESVYKHGGLPDHIASSLGDAEMMESGGHELPDIDPEVHPF